MTSVIKVDNIQTSSGSAPNAATLGFEAGSVVKTTLFPVIGRVTISSLAAFSNNRSNYKTIGSSYTKSITVRTNNPILLITGTIVLASTSTSHKYFDFKLTGDSTGWASQKIISTADGLVTNHITSIDEIFPTSVHLAWETSLTAGQSVTFDPQVATWAAGNILTNQYRDGNSNQDMVTRFICQEIAT